ncbi:hypothetical protein ACVIF9_009515 [Bradyrhizobium sp. USDA 4350]
MPDHRAELAHQAIGHLAGHRQLARALELRDRVLGIGADRAGRLELAVAVFGQRPLDRCDALAGRAQMLCRDRPPADE